MGTHGNVATDFPPTTRELASDDGQRRLVQVIGCSQCSNEEVLVAKGTRSLPASAVRNMLSKKGWLLGKRGRRDKDVCPDCLAQEKAPPRPVPEKVQSSPVVDLDPPTPKPAVREALELVPDPPPVKFTVMEDPVMVEKPRQPTLAENRRIMETLTEVYVGEGTGYADDWSDETVAAKLNVPPVWIRDVRERFFGENGGNEATSKTLKDLARIETQIKATEDRIMQALSSFDNEISQLKTEAERLRKRLGA